MNNFLTKEELLSLKSKLKTEEVVIPELGGKKVIVKELTAKQKDKMELKAYAAAKDGADANFNRSEMITMTVFNPDGQTRMFKPEDIKLVEQLPATVVTRLFNVAMKLSRLQPADIEEEVRD